MKRWLPYALIAASIVLGLYAFFLRPSDEDLIRARLDQIAVAVRIDESELNPIIRHGRVKEAFREVFTKDVLARVPELSTSVRSRDDLVVAATQLQGAYASAEVRFGDVDIRVDEARNAARVTAVATLAGARNGEVQRSDERKVALELDKVDGDWKVVSVTVWPPEEDDEGLN